jgi:hypothetical protein
MTVSKCVTFCPSQSFRFAGLQAGYACFCGNSYGRFGKAEGCDKSSEKCGGHCVNGVWRIR